MTKDETLLDQRVHDAYERIELSGEAQERMLAALRAAQEAGASESAAAPSGESAPVAQGEPRAHGWRLLRPHVLVPLAAVLLAAVVIVRVSGGAGGGSRMAANDAAPSVVAEKAAETDGVAYDAEVSEDAADALEVTASSTGAASLVDLCPQVTLSDGTQLTALVDTTHAEEVAASEVGPSLGDATAAPFDADRAVACEVFELADDPDAFAVRYDGEDSYWRCLPL